MPVEPKSGSLSRRDFLKVTGAGLAAAAFGWREFGSAPSAYSLESGLRNLYVATTKKYEATPVPGSDVEGSLITYNPENFPRLESYWVQWKLQQEFGGNAQMVHRYREQHNLYTKEQLDGRTTFGFLVQDRKNDKNTLYPYVIGPDRLTVPNSKDVFVYAWAGGSSFVKLEAAVYPSEEALSVLPGLEASTGGNFVIFGEPASTQQGTILPHFYYVWQEGSNFIPPMTFITPDGKNAVEITMPRGVPKLASLVSAAAPEITNSEVKPAYTETVDIEYMGVKMNIKIVTDKSVTTNTRYKVDKVTLNPKFVNKYGEDSAHSITRLVAFSIYRAWQRNGTEAEAVERNNVSFKKYWAKLSKAQRENSEEVWKEVEYQVNANDLNTDNYEISKVILRPGTVRLVFVDEDYVKNITEDIGNPNRSTNFSAGTNIGLDRNLEIWIGFPFGLNYDPRYGDVISSDLNLALRRMYWKSQGRALGPAELQEFRKSFNNDSWHFIANPTSSNPYYHATALMTSPSAPGDWANAGN